MMTLGDGIVLVVLAGWLLATILYQIFTAQWRATVRRRDPFRWLVTYHLFSGTYRDLTLRYRDQHASGVMDDWTVIPIVSPYRWRHAIWHPEKRSLNAMAWMVDELVQMAEDRRDPHGRRPMPERFIYRSVLRQVMRLQRSPGTTGRQFCIDEIAGRTDQADATCFCSDVHPYEPVHGS